MLPAFIGAYLFISVLQLAFSQQSITFIAKDEIMQVMPINPLVIYSARITFKLIEEEIKTLIFLTPLFVSLYYSGYYTHLLGNVYFYFLRSLLVIITIPCLSLFLGIIFQPILVYIKAVIKKSNFLYLIMLTIISIVIIYIVSKVFINIEDDFGYIRIDIMRKRFKVYDTLVAKFIKDTFLIKYLSGGILKANLGFVPNLDYTRINFSYHFLIFIAYTFLFMILAGLVIYLTYYDLINISKARSLKVKKNNLIFTKINNLFSLYFIKELVTFWRNKTLFRKQINYYFIIPIMAFLINFILKKIDLNYVGVRLASIINLAISLLLLLFANISAAISFSSDANLFNQMREDIPDIKKIIHAKLLFNLINASLLSIINIVMILIFNPFNKYLSKAPIAIGLILFLASIMHTLLVFINDLKNYQAQNLNYDKNKSVTYGITLGIILSLVIISLEFIKGFNNLVDGQFIVSGILFSAIILIVIELESYLKVIINKAGDYLSYE